MKKILTVAGMVLSLTSFSQILQYNPPSPSIADGCNVFSSNPTQSGYTHYGELGGVGYVGSAGIGIQLPVSIVNYYPSYGTAYTVGLALTVGRAYTITAKALSSFSGDPTPPQLMLSASGNRQTSASSCTQADWNNLYDMFHVGNSTGLNVGVSSFTSIPNSTSQTYTLLSNYYPVPGMNYLNIGARTPAAAITYSGYVAIQEIDITYTTPTTPLINGSSSYFFSSSHSSGNGTITGQPGATITVSVNAGGSTGNYTTQMGISGASFTDGSTTLSVTNGSAWKQLICPASGSISWNGTYSYPNTFGSGTISVQ